jgi:hypothetical protein
VGHTLDLIPSARAIAADLRTDPSFLSIFRGGTEGQLWYYGALADAFTALVAPAIAEELR